MQVKATRVPENKEPIHWQLVVPNYVLKTCKSKQSESQRTRKLYIGSLLCHIPTRRNAEKESYLKNVLYKKLKQSFLKTSSSPNMIGFGAMVCTTILDVDPFIALWAQMQPQSFKHHIASSSISQVLKTKVILKRFLCIHETFCISAPHLRNPRVCGMKSIIAPPIAYYMEVRVAFNDIYHIQRVPALLELLPKDT